MPASRETARAALRALREHKRQVDQAIERLEAYANTAARVQQLMPRDELRQLMALADRSSRATQPPPELRPAA